MASVLYGTDTFGRSLWSIDRDTPSSSTRIGSFPSSVFGLNGLTLHDGELLCVGSDTIGRDILVLVDRTTPSNSTVIGILPSGVGSATGLASHEGELLCVDNAGDELWLLDRTTPSSSTLIGTLPTGLSTPNGIASHGGELLGVGTDGDELWLLNRTTPSSSTAIGEFPSGLASPRGLASHEGELLCVDSSGDELWLVDRTTPSSSTLIGALPSGVQTAVSLASYPPHRVRGSTTYSFSSRGVVDHTPAPPSTAHQVSGNSDITLDTSGRVDHVLAPITDRTVLYGLENQDNQLWSIDASDPSASTLVGDFPDTSAFSNLEAIAIHNGELLLSTGLQLWSVNYRSLGDSSLIGSFPSSVGSIRGMVSHGGELLGASSSEDALILIDRDNLSNSSVLGSFPDGLGSSQGLASHGGELICVNSTSPDELWLIDRDTPSDSSLIGPLPSALGFPRGMASVGGELLCMDSGGSEIWLVDRASPSDSTLRGTLPSGYTRPFGMASVTTPPPHQVRGASDITLTTSGRVTIGGSRVTHAVRGTSSLTLDTTGRVTKSDQVHQVRGASDLTLTTSGQVTKVDSRVTHLVRGSSQVTLTSSGQVTNSIAPITDSSLLYLLENQDNELWLVDRDNPSSSTLEGSFPSSISNVDAIAIHNGELLLSTGPELWFVNYRSLEDSTLIGAFPASVGSIRGMVSHGGELLGASNSTDALILIDRDNLSNSSVLGSFPDGLGGAHALASHNRELLSVNSANPDELWLIDRDTPSDSSLIGPLPSNLNFPRGLASLGGELLCVDAGGSELWLVDRNDTVNSSLIGTLPSGFNRPFGLASITQGSVHQVRGSTTFTFATTGIVTKTTSSTTHAVRGASSLTLDTSGQVTKSDRVHSVRGASDLTLTTSGQVTKADQVHSVRGSSSLTLDSTGVVTKADQVHQVRGSSDLNLATTGRVVIGGSRVTHAVRGSSDLTLTTSGRVVSGNQMHTIRGVSDLTLDSTGRVTQLRTKHIVRGASDFTLDSTGVVTTADQAHQVRGSSDLTLDTSGVVTATTPSPVHQVRGSSNFTLDTTGVVTRTEGVPSIAHVIRGNSRLTLDTSGVITGGTVIVGKRANVGKVYGAVTGIYAYVASTYGVSDAEGVSPDQLNNNLFPEWIVDVREGLVLDEVDILTIQVKRGCPWHIENVVDKNDRIVVATDTTGDGEADTWRLYRTRNITIGTGDQSAYKVECWSIDVDLTTTIWGWQPDGFTTYLRTYDFVGYTVREVINEIFAPLPDVFTIGTIQDSLANLVVSPIIRNSTVSEAIDAVRVELEQHDKTLEYEMSYSHETGNVTFDFWEQRGMSTVERAAGMPDPSLRVIAAPFIMSDRGNRIGATVQNVQDDYASRLVARGGGEESEDIGLGAILWDVISATNSGANTVLVLEEGAIAFEDQYNSTNLGTWAVRESNGTTHEIVSTSYTANSVTVTGNIAPSEVAFVVEVESGIYRDADYVRRPDGEPEQGIVERIEDFPGVVPYANLFEVAGGSGDISDWSGGLPLGIVPYGSATVEENSSRIYVTQGKRSAKVTCDEGDGIQIAFTVQDLELNPYISSCAVLQVMTGRVRMFIEDSAGVLFPRDDEQQHEGLPTVTSALKTEGFDPAVGVAALHIVAKSDNTVFYLDSLAITQSPTAWAYTPYMGPKALYRAASVWMMANGGVRPLTTSAKYVNLEFLGEDIETIRVGSWVRMKDLKSPSGDDYYLQLDGRVEKIENASIGPALGGGFAHVATIGRQRESVIERLQKQLPERIPYPEFPMGKAPIVDAIDLGQGIITWQDGGEGYLRYTPPDTSRVTKFEVHISIGGPLPEPGMETWTELMITDEGYYQTNFTIDLDHLSWIRYRIEIDDGASTSIIGEVSFDADLIPELSNIWLDWIPVNRDVVAHWRTDEDTEAVIYASSEVQLSDITDAAFDTALAAGDFVNGNGIQSATIDNDLLPGKTIYVGLRPAKGTLTTSTDPDDVEAGTDAFIALRVPSTGDAPIWNLEHSKSGSVVTVTLTIVRDDAGLVERVESRSALGRLLTSTDTYSEVTRSNSGTDLPAEYDTELNLEDVKKRDSYLQYKIVTPTGVDDIILDPFTLDADNNPEALINWSHNYDSTSERWDFRVAWAGDDDLGSIRIVLNSNTSNSNLTQSQVTAGSGFTSLSAWSLTVTGYTENDQMGDSRVLLELTGRFPPPPGEIFIPSDDSTITDILADIADLQRDIQGIVDDSEDWSSTVTFSASGEAANRHNRIVWTEGTVTYLENAAQNVNAGQLTLTDGDGRYYVYYDPDNHQAALRTTTDIDNVTGNAFVMCIAWASVSGTDANIVSTYGALEETLNIQANIANVNILSALQASIADLSAIVGRFTGSVIISGDGSLIWGVGLDSSGTYTVEEGSGYINQDGIYIKGSGTDFFQIVGDGDEIKIVHGNSDRLIIGSETAGAGAYNGPFNIQDDLTAEDDLIVEGNLRVTGGNVESGVTKPGNVSISGDLDVTGGLTVDGQSVIDADSLTVTETTASAYSNEFLCSQITYDDATSTLSISNFPLGLSELIALSSSGDGTTATQFVAALSPSSSGTGLQYILRDLPVKSIAFSGTGSYLKDATLSSDGVLRFTRGD